MMFNASEVLTTHTFDEWLQSLDIAARAAIDRMVDLLRAQGTGLRFPYSSGIEKSRHRRMRELRIKYRGRQLRVFYAFDPLRAVILLAGGDKTGDDRFYERMVARADALYDAHLADLERKGGR